MAGKARGALADVLIEGELLTGVDDGAVNRIGHQMDVGDPGLAGRLRAVGLERARQYAWPDICRRTVDFYSELLAAR